MGLFNAIKKQLLKVIKWDDASTDTIVYRYPMEDRDEIMNGCQLIVSESQVAMLVTQGQIADVFGPGAHKLTTNNIPILTKIAGWKYGFDSPFKADVYYVNTKQFTNQKWGTSSKITLRDQEFGLVRAGARGTYAFSVNDAPKFMKEIFGTNKEYSTNSLVEYFKGIIVTNFTKVIGEIKMPVIDMPSKLVEISDAVKEELADDFDNIGLLVRAFYVEAITLPEEVETAIDKRATTGILGGVADQFIKVQTGEAIREAARNEGSGSAGSGMGLAAGIAMGQQMMNSFANMNQQNQQNQPQNNQTTGLVVCPSCGASVSPGKFCSNCGKALPTKRYCSNCGNELSEGTKFCPNCGKKVE